MSRKLCSSCLNSFELADLMQVDRGHLCPECRENPVPPTSEIPVKVPLAEPQGLVRRFFRMAGEWCAGKAWYVRLPLLIYFVQVLYRQLFEPNYRSIIDNLNFGIHELGHPLFGPFGEFLMVAGGTILEVGAPIGAGIMFFYQRDFFAIACSAGWLSTALFSVAIYCGDARALALPLAAPGVGVLPHGTEELHDWHRMLKKLGMLEWDGVLSFGFHAASVVAMLACLTFGSWLCWQMFRRKGFNWQAGDIGE